jgi:thymidylate kinase
MSIERQQFLSIHGIDGTGKTATARAVKAEAEARGLRMINYDEHEYRKNNPHSNRKEALDKEGSPEERLIAHLESTLYHSDQINKLISDGYHVVKSRYLDDVMAHFSHMGIEQEQLESIVRKFPIVQPDLKVILTLDEAIRQQRVNERGDATEADTKAKVIGSRALFFEDYVKRAVNDFGRSLQFDTGSMDSQAIARVIVDDILRTV